MIVSQCCVIGHHHDHNHCHYYPITIIVFCFRAMFVNLPGLIMIVSLCCMIGVVMYAFYADCHPITYGVIKNTDQVITHFHSMEHAQCGAQILHVCLPTDKMSGVVEKDSTLTS